ncbi:type 1 glutamine amidotransferase [Sphingobacterium oryzagri]|uniref:Type 1 glutamine amidotransferase n=1 Tax=Sphingobacterium oryzagri TaxID=3025669 RepID=A0ABY7WPM2_9SPHI|nr:type 1 glutamine amidotransferase domain-containing protein [Sphingobacterium sp. KACC 22765]WDF70363.1 type 1 glutamine amidotransferase [Sphingobacterium sp. KACC 22765]
MKEKIAILTEVGFEEVELTSPKEALEKQGYEVHIISPNEKSKIKSWNHTDWGKEFDVDVAVEEADPADYVGVILPGGVINPDKLRVSEESIAFIDHFVQTNKLIAAICHGPLILTENGFVKDKKLTSVNNIKTDLVHAGGQWEDSEVVIDKNLITSRTPEDLDAFNNAINSYLSNKN